MRTRNILKWVSCCLLSVILCLLMACDADTHLFSRVVDDSAARAGVAGGAEPGIHLEKATNGHDADEAPGPALPVGDPVTWTYVVTNVGDGPLTSISVVDDQGVAVSCPRSALEPGESMTCTGSGTAVTGQYQNLGTVTGNAPGGTTVSDEDPSHYLGETNASIDLEKATNGHDADVAPGPTLVEGDPVEWTYVVTNTGEVALEDISVTDDQGVAVSCPRSSLQVGESMTCTGHGTAQAGQYGNVGSATGTAPDGSEVTDEDPSHYLGEAVLVAAIDLEKATNGHDADVEPGPTLPEGSLIEWTYVVTNTGDVPLVDVTVVDDQGADVICPTTMLGTGESMTCTAGGIVALGQYSNVGTASGTVPDGPTVIDEDPSHYFGEPREEGCSLGYWKNHLDAWPPTGYSPDQSVESVFSEAAAYPALAAATLHEGLKLKGGPTVEAAAGLLLKQAIAALLNAAHPDISYPRSENALIANVNAALATGDRQTILSFKDNLDTDNNLGCPGD